MILKLPRLSEENPMNMDINENKVYVKCNIVSDDIFKGVYSVNSIDLKVMERLSKDIGFSYDLYCTLASIDQSVADNLVSSMCKKSKLNDITLLIDTEISQVIGYSLDSERVPVLNLDFLKRVNSLVDANSSDVKIVETQYSPERTTASIIMKRVTPVQVEEKNTEKGSTFTEYEVGVILTNDELNSVSCRLVLFVEGHPLYLPASYYTSSTSRYRRSTANSLDALDVLTLKVIEDLREFTFAEKLSTLHYRYKANKNIAVTYEEYKALLRTMRKIPDIIEDNNYLDPLVSKYDNFEQKYAGVEDQESSYIWRCTALGDLTIGALVYITVKILYDLAADPATYTEIRELLGTYISTHRIVEEIAKENIT